LARINQNFISVFREIIFVRCPSSELNRKVRRPVNHPYRPSWFRDLEKNRRDRTRMREGRGKGTIAFRSALFNEAYQSPRLYIRVGIARKDYRGSSLEIRGGHTWRPQLRPWRG